MSTFKYTRSIFIFHRDLRIYDNTGLLEALTNSQYVLPCFIFDPAQVGSTNPYRGDHCIQFMLDSLRDLELQFHSQQARLHFYFEDTVSMVKKLIQLHNIDSVFSNRDYTPFSQKRDNSILEECEKLNVKFKTFDDSLITTPEQVLKSDGTSYSIFTPFYNAAIKKPVASPEYLWNPESLLPDLSKVKNIKIGSFLDLDQETVSLDQMESKILKIRNPDIVVKGGRKEGIQLLKKATKLQDYHNNRNIPSKQQTSYLSPHNKFGTVSVREVFKVLSQAYGKQSAIIRELYFRDFWTHVAVHHPRVFLGSYHTKFNKLSWQDDKKFFEEWRQGKTGFPIVDAGMRELLATGNMHGRVRMIVASFLTKDLHIDWREGEKYFAQMLVDYDPCVNNGNWQWVASTGGDAQPYFRIFNPWLQQKKFDPQCEYIKKWVPEVRGIPNDILHKWNTSHISYKKSVGSSKKKELYPSPIIDHDVEKNIALERYRNVSQNSD